MAPRDRLREVSRDFEVREGECVEGVEKMDDVGVAMSFLSIYFFFFHICIFIYAGDMGEGIVHRSTSQQQGHQMHTLIRVWLGIVIGVVI